MKEIILTEQEHKNLVNLLNTATLQSVPLAAMKTIAELIDKVANAKDKETEVQEVEEILCKVCGKKFQDENAYYNHYNEVHNKSSSRN